MPPKRKPKTKKRVAKRKASPKTKKRKSMRSSAPVAYSQSTRAHAPSISGSKGQIRIKHRELIDGSIVGTAAWHLYDTLVINPGISDTFPWLASQAANWETYKFNSLQFQYITRCPTSTSGSLSLVPEYNVLDDPPTTEEQTICQDMREDSVWKNFSISCRTSNLASGRTRHFVRGSAVPAGSSLVDYDVAKLYIATNDGVDAAKWGKLWVEYDVSLFTPQVAVPAAFSDFLIDAPRIEGSEEVSMFGSTGNLAHCIPLDANVGSYGGMLAEDANTTGYRYMTFPWEGYYLVTFTYAAPMKDPTFNNAWPGNVIGAGITTRSYTNWLNTTSYSMGWFILGIGDGKSGSTPKRLDVTVDFANLVSFGAGGTVTLTISMAIAYMGIGALAALPPGSETKHGPMCIDDDEYVALPLKTSESSGKARTDELLSVETAVSKSRPSLVPVAPKSSLGKGNGSSSSFSMTK